LAVGLKKLAVISRQFAVKNRKTGYKSSSDFLKLLPTSIVLSFNLCF